MGIQRSRKFDRYDHRITNWMADNGILFLRISIGIIYIWFGVLKFFPNLSPAEDLAARTIDVISFGMIPSEISMPILAFWECIIGIGLLVGKKLRIIIFLLGLQMIGAISPIFLFPDEVFIQFPFVLTIEGQYIFKNLVIISSAIVIGATVRGGKLIADPAVADAAKKREKQKLVD